MNGSTFLLRCKAACIRHGPVLLGLMVLVAMLGFGGAAWAYTHPPTEVVTEQTHHQTVETTVNESAVVVGNTSLWDRGTVLSNKPFYPLPAASNFTLRVVTAVPSGQSVHVDQRLSIVYRAGDGGSELWKNQRVIAEQATETRNGEAVLETTIDVDEVRTQRDGFNQALLGIDRAEVMLALDVHYETDRYSGNLSTSAPFAIGNNRYSIDGSLDSRQAHSTPVTREVPAPRKGTVYYMLVMGLLSSVGAAVSYRVYEGEDDVETVENEIHRTRFAEWISEGRIKRPIGEQDVPMRTLADLVDVAIDSKRRVVYDPVRDLYAVVDGDILYYHHPGIEAVFEDAPRPVVTGPDGDEPDVDLGTDRDPWGDLIGQAADRGAAPDADEGSDRDGRPEPDGGTDAAARPADAPTADPAPSEGTRGGGPAGEVPDADRTGPEEGHDDDRPAADAGLGTEGFDVGPASEPDPDAGLGTDPAVDAGEPDENRATESAPVEDVTEAGPGFEDGAVEDVSEMEDDGVPDPIDADVSRAEAADAPAPEVDSDDTVPEGDPARGAAPERSESPVATDDGSSASGSSAATEDGSSASGSPAATDDGPSAPEPERPLPNAARDPWENLMDEDPNGR